MENFTLLAQLAIVSGLVGYFGGQMISVQDLFEPWIVETTQKLQASDNLIKSKLGDLLHCNVCSGSQVALWTAVGVGLAATSLSVLGVILAAISAVSINMMLQDKF